MTAKNVCMQIRTHITDSSTDIQPTVQPIVKLTRLCWFIN